MIVSSGLRLNSEYSIWTSLIACTAWGAADGLGANLGQADGADVPGLDEFGDRSDRLLDGNGGVEPGRAVDVDVVGAEALQGVGEEGLQGCRGGNRFR